MSCDIDIIALRSLLENATATFEIRLWISIVMLSILYSDFLLSNPEIMIRLSPFLKDDTVVTCGKLILNAACPSTLFQSDVIMEHGRSIVSVQIENEKNEKENPATSCLEALQYLVVSEDNREWMSSLLDIAFSVERQCRREDPR
jgi:hypothetical protein